MYVTYVPLRNIKILIPFLKMLLYKRGIKNFFFNFILSYNMICDVTIRLVNKCLYYFKELK
ncbi:hypothetical protein PFMALIP_05455 [Plasmodium falciparum MaliPS096_E11]|uniref:Uncharacterized protein n=2 Tax=Plasmodium falciparum TaxID=5833 RepID=A0A024X0K4_PLAFC|nr:hypothetical protein PFMALIP_05455 [Plasmodium falciparum MaliPS096_E11]ETW58600.1 hypothetical protein PFMC_05697 [Plasmodium falciparum CAMP/Malaysia]